MDKPNEIKINTAVERRAFPRIAHHNDVRVFHPRFGEGMMKVRDFSDTGVYLWGRLSGEPKLDEVVEVQVQGLPVEAPRVEAKIVRIEKTGLAFEFCN